VSAVVFAGPSLYGRKLALKPEIMLRPPAAQGDIYRACKLRPQAIGLIDGYFEGVPSVWHKEVLWALSQGIAVYGSASMGALRAAELDVFGMTGIGEIYEWYRSGAIEDDDEVALLHGPAEAGFVPLSEPSVNVRASCAAAVGAGVVDAAAAGRVIAAARALHYKERQWGTILEQAGAAGLDPGMGKRLADWLDEGRVDQKQRDALALIDAVSDALDRPGERQAVTFRFEWTDLWDQVKREWDAEGPPLDAPRDMAGAVIDELRLDADRYASLRAQAVARAMALAGTGGDTSEIGHGARRAQLASLRENLGLMRKSDLDAWVARNGLDESKLQALLETEARLDAARRLPEALIEREILALLYLSDAYAELAERARRKRAVLEATSLTEAGLPHGLTVPVLLDWYFRHLRRQPVPDNLDMLIGQLGLASRTAFYRLLAAEYVYSATQRGG
jgi:hypothetical protein